MCSGVLNFLNELMPAFTVIVGHQRNHHCTIWKQPKAFLYFRQVDVKWPVADQFYIVESHYPAPVVINGRIPRRDVLDLRTYCLPYHTSPAGFECTDHINL